MKYLLSLFLLTLTVTSFAKEVEEREWPREIQLEEYLITLYQPQLESLEDNMLDGRMALSVQNDSEGIIFGALWFDARLSTDLTTRIAILEDLKIPMIKFPDIEDESKLEQLKNVIINDFKSRSFEMSIDRIIASVEEVVSSEKTEAKLENKAPVIYYRNAPAVLVNIDGDPILKDVDDSKMQYVINTPFFLVKKGKWYYMKGGEYWYRSKEIVSEEWDETSFVPDEVEKLAKKSIDSEETPIDGEVEEGAPEIIITTGPAELLISQGEPKYESVEGTSLLYVSNTESDILMDINSQDHYILVAGRWYTSKELKKGDWKFAEPEGLPEDFSKIPETSTLATVRVSVPGTPENKEAQFEQYVPQTAVVDRKTATVEVTYDGEPKFEKIEGTDMSYAVNTASTVVIAKGKYYCVDDGIWFSASTAKGPWTVSDSRPTEVDEIPATSPVNNIKYVYIYDSTPDVVYVGYTPGYYHSYMYGGCVVYGTGYHYNPWYGTYYYPRPVTYGYSVHYNPYTGWGFSVGVSYGWLTVSSRNYWGPSGYSHGYRHGYNQGYHRGYHNGYRAGYARGKYDSRNSYQNRNSGIRQTGSTARRDNIKQDRGSRPSNKPNNVFTDSNGNVSQRDSKGNWQQKTKNAGLKEGTRPSTTDRTRPAAGTKPSTIDRTRPAAGTRPSTTDRTRPAAGTKPSMSRPQSPAPRTNQNNMNSDYNRRTRSNTRTNNYNNTRNRSYSGGGGMQSRPRPSGGGRRK